MPVVVHDDVPFDPFAPGATYQTVVEGEGEAWMEGREPFPIAPGMTLVFPANTRHWFRALGARPLKTFGLHASPHRVVIEHEDDGKSYW